MVTKEVDRIVGVGEEELGTLLLKIVRLPAWGAEGAWTVTLSAEEEEERKHYGYKAHLPMHITGDVEKRATNILFVDGAKVAIGDVPFALLLRLVVELFKNKVGTVPKSTLIKGGYIKADSEFQSIRRLREAFNGALRHCSPEELVETCGHRTLRLSVHPALISYDKQKLLGHYNKRISRLAGRLP